MPYATLADMLAEYNRPEDPELTQRVPAAVGDGPDAEQIEEALAEAAGLMDEHIGARYALPLTGLAAPRAAWLRRVNLEIARYLVAKDRAAEDVRQRYADHVRYLRDLAKGVITWPDQGQPATSAAGGPDYSAPSARFDADYLEDY